VARAGIVRLPAPPLGEAATLADQAYLAIRHLIVTLELPPGAAIKEPELTARLGIGRTPVREALRRLALERLVAVFPRRGMEVTTVDVRDLARLCEVRAVLEPEAARLASDRATRADLDEIHALHHELDDRRRRDDRSLIVLDERIHRAIYRATHNLLLEETLDWYYTHALRIWMLALDRTNELQDAVIEHRRLLEAIAHGNGDRAAELMHAHVLSFEEAMRDVLLEP
jgi:DNA-binding GntR family transcriptional regulator